MTAKQDDEKEKMTLHLNHCLYFFWKSSEIAILGQAPNFT